jgi:hypothetical protein
VQERATGLLAQGQVEEEADERLIHRPGPLCSR